ncbi:MAG: head maturation protease, ClpP-related [Liquorilactobacillus ghanensis]|uniref:head maturation protease, ClpP-related n=1 Tax=Liquorilactobacillus ghanensis TaxID=399370 RepID=UPI0039E7C805
MKTLNVKGTIISNSQKGVYNWLGWESTAPQDILPELTGSDPIQVDINSGGGLISAGNEIYTALKGYSGQLTINIVGMAASAASLIAMAGDEVLISPVGQIMIHNVSAIADGDYHDMDSMSEALQTANSALANGYVAKTGKSKDEILALMDKTTFLDADQAIENGFADKKMFDSGQQTNFQLVAAAGTVIPDKAIQAIRNLQQENKQLKKQTNLDPEAIAASIFEKMKNNKPEPTKSDFSRFVF